MGNQTDVISIPMRSGIQIPASLVDAVTNPTVFIADDGLSRISLGSNIDHQP